jgi:hypothetical protein
MAGQLSCWDLADCTRVARTLLGQVMNRRSAHRSGGLR